MTLNPEVVRARWDEIIDSVGRLERMATLPLEQVLGSQDMLDVACYRLLVAIAAALALCYHVSARQLRKAPADYPASFAILRDAGLLPADLAERLQRMARFRNLLVHMYWKIDYHQVYEVIRHDRSTGARRRRRCGSGLRQGNAPGAP